jgi:C1A family cysteine protease
LYSVAPPAKLPASVDLRTYASPIDDQGNLGSCTGNALAGAIDLMDKKTENKNLRVSRLFIYYQERAIEGDITQDAGARISDGVNACSQTGACLESIWPYTISQFAVKPSQAAYNDAVHRKITSASKCADITAIKTALANGTPVVGGFMVYASFESAAVARTGIMPFPDVAREQCLGGHAVCFVGYNDAKSWFIVRNSWGTSWGDKGYFYMPYQVVTTPNMASDFWAITGVTNS